MFFAESAWSEIREGKTLCATPETYPPFQANDFEYLRGRILILLPENDIFKKEDQKRFADLFRKLDAEIRTVPGGHVGFIVQAERYLDLMETFLQRNGI